MARYKVKLAYDGTDFSGYQRQQDSPTVQEVVETALRRIGWQGEGILAAGRTDAGVHAAGQVIAFDLEWGHSEAALLAALNANLPAAVAAGSVRRTADQFHPRYDASARQYVYTIFCQPVRNPMLERFAWRQWPVLNLETLQHAAKLLIGTHDFRGLGRALKPGGSTTREVMQADWARAGETFRFTIRANAFLYHMVRRTVFALIVAGRDSGNPDLIRKILDHPDENAVQGLAPAQGLVLERVFYPDEVEEPDRG